MPAACRPGTGFNLEQLGRPQVGLADRAEPFGDQIGDRSHSEQILEALPFGFDRPTTVIQRLVLDPSLFLGDSQLLEGPSSSWSAPVSKVSTGSLSTRPSGTSSAGRETPRTVAGAQLNFPNTAAAWAASGSGRCSARDLVQPRVPGNGEGPHQPGGGVQPADRVGRPPQAQDQPDGRIAEREGQRLGGPLDQHRDRQRPSHDQGDRQGGRAAGEGGQPQRPGKQDPGPGLQPTVWSSARSGHGAAESEGPAVRDRYGPDRCGTQVKSAYSWLRCRLPRRTVMLRKYSSGKAA
jgi:hypothetical protein